MLGHVVLCFLFLHMQLLQAQRAMPEKRMPAAPCSKHVKTTYFSRLMIYVMIYVFKIKLIKVMHSKFVLIRLWFN